VVVRPIGPGDGERLARFHESLSEQTRYRRFLSLHPHLSDDEVAYFTVLDHPDRVAYVAESDGELVAVGRYDRVGDAAEVAFVVADAWQGQGLATVLMSVLATCAARHGICSFFAEVLCGNRQMLQVFQAAGYELGGAVDDGVRHVTFALEPRAKVGPVSSG
jgi:GNAT superfamily N-acetyltransferase